MKTRDKIIHASLALFNEHGERDITTNHIASHLGISPGNLYYHFRNKEDIIRSIFALYEQAVTSRFLPYEDQKVDINLLTGYFDSLFSILWQFRFIYANLVSILNRDSTLCEQYNEINDQVLGRACNILRQLKQDNVLAIDDAEIPLFADSIRVISCFWISNCLTLSQTQSITKTSIYEGILRVLLMFKAHSTEEAKATFIQVEQYYRDLSNQTSQD